MTIEELRAFFAKPPQQKLIEQKAKLPQGYISKILSGSKTLTPDVVNKILPVMKEEYDFKSKDDGKS